MATFPEGVTLCRLTMGKAATWGGQIAKIDARLSSTHNVVHAASGWSFSSADDKYQSGPTDELEIDVPHTDQPGFRDADGNAFTGWAYIVSGTRLFPGGKKQNFTANVQPLVGQTVIDLDLLPTGLITGPVTGPQAVVQSLAGRTGMITVEELAEDLDGLVGGGIPPESVGAPDGVAPLDSSARVPEAVLPTRLSEAAVAGVAGLQAAGRTPGFIGGPLSRFLARVVRRDIEPVVIQLFGTSQVEGIAPTEWPYLLNDVVQGVWPLSIGDPSPAIRTMNQYIAAPSLSPGVQIINAGVSGSTAATMLPGNFQSTAEALAPSTALYIVMSGTNDWETNVLPATFAANLRAEINPVRAATTKPATWLFIHGNERLSTTSGGTYPWDQYREAMRSVAADHPNDSLFLDLSDVLRGIGVGLGGTDPLDLLSDTVHYNDVGNAWLLEAVVNALALPRPSAAGVAPGPAGSWERIYSDGFTGADAADINGRTFDNTLGGAGAATWTNSPAASVATSGGRMAKGATTGNYFAGRAAPGTSMRFRWRLVTRQSTGTTPLVFSLARLSAAGGAIAGVSVQMQAVSTGAALALSQRDSTGTTNIVPGTLGALADGDVLMIEIVDNATVRLFKNGTLVGSGPISAELVNNLNYGFTGATTTVGWAVDEFEVFQWVEA